MNRSQLRQLHKKTQKIYTICCSGIIKMPTLQSKKFLTKMALQLNALLNIQKIQEQVKEMIVKPQPKIMHNSQTQTQQIYSPFLADKDTVQSICNSQSSQSEYSFVYNQYEEGEEDPQLVNIIDKFDRILKEKTQAYTKQIDSFRKQNINLLKKIQELEAKQKQYSNIRKETIVFNEKDNNKSDYQVKILRDQIKRLEGQLANSTKQKMKIMKENTPSIIR